MAIRENNSKLLFTPLKILILSILIITLGLVFFHLNFRDKAYPGISVAGYSVGGKTSQEIIGVLRSNIKVPERITLTNGEKDIEINLEDIDFHYDYPISAAKAIDLYKHISPENINRSLLTFYNKPAVDLAYSYNTVKLKEMLSIIESQVNKEPIYPEIITQGKKLDIKRGETGYTLDIVKLQNDLESKFEQADFSPIPIQLITNDPTLTDRDIDSIKKRFNKFNNKTLIFTANNQSLKYQGDELAALIAVNSYSEQRIEVLIDNLASKIEREPQNAVFKFDSGKVQEFVEGSSGIKIKKEDLFTKIFNSLTELENNEETVVTIAVPVSSTPPDITTKDVNNLGINQLIGQGNSKFSGSIPSRVHNVNLAASKFNGVLIAPGETMSFNKILGDVSSLTGYKQAYVIRDGQTVLGDGGGVCQVSTTLFRAALNAGLPVVERRAHSYRVGYYEQGSPPGLDATIFDPTTDLKIKNDTPSHILIQTKTDIKSFTLTFELYGTHDGRQSTTTKPVVSALASPPEDLYIDDPSLPAGTIKQIDWKAWGAKVSFKYSVEKEGKVVYEKTFVSTYRPWQAKFLRGTGSI